MSSSRVCVGAAAAVPLFHPSLDRIEYSSARGIEKVELVMRIEVLSVWALVQTEFGRERESVAGTRH